MAHRNRQSASRRRPAAARRFTLGPGLIVGLVVAVLVVAGLALLIVNPAGQAAAPTTAPPPVVAPTATEGCRSLPAFARDPALGLTGGLAIATDRPQKGLVLLSVDQPDQPYQHPTWDDAGFLGALAYDRDGNVYAAPTPRLSLADNPLAGATTLWRAETATGELAPFVTLPGTASERNPFGIMGLTYVCELNQLYAGTVIGSTPTTEQGGVVAITLPDKQLRPMLTDTDVMGVLVVRTGAGFELYAGLARSPEVVAVPLDMQGNPTGPPRPLLDLTAAGATPSERARKLRLVDGELVADLVPFNFSLQANASGTPQNRQATWTYDLATDAWVVSRPASGQ